MEEEKESSVKLIELMRSQPNPEEFAEKVLMIVEHMSGGETVSKANETV